MKICTKCKVEKPISKFSQWKPGKFRGSCLDCRSKDSKKLYRENIEKYQSESRSLGLKKSYWKELTKEEALNEYEKLFNLQSGCCAICKKHQSEFKRKLFVDHNHKTQKVRGLLCHRCNAGIGMLDGDSDTSKLDAAKAYLLDSI